MWSTVGSSVIRNLRQGVVLVTFTVFVVLLGLIATFATMAAAPAPLRPASFLAAISPASVDAQQWIKWGANQYALAEDNQALWIGTNNGVVRWDKAQHTYQRYTAVDGLPQYAIYTIAIDAAGNHWFGGDQGLSRLDVNNQWTHFSVANSGLYSDLVDEIAVGLDDTLWLSHGLPNGSVSRRNPDGTWYWFPNRAAAVASDYVRIRETRNANRLWTVASNEIWVGYQVYNGSTWSDRPPYPNASSVGIAADSTGQVWTIDSFGVYSWNGSSWLRHGLRDFPTGGSYTTLAVGPDDTTWLGGGGVLTCSSACPGSSYNAAIAQAQKTDSFRFLARIGPVQALLPTTGGVWAVGAGWLMQPDGTFYDFTDIPLYRKVSDALLDTNGLLWVHSQFSNGALQTLNDQGTSRLGDDVWKTERTLGQLNAAVEQTPGGDLWVAERSSIREPVQAPKRLHKGRWLEYPFPSFYYSSDTVVDVFAEDETHTWFAFSARITLDGQSEQRILALDDKGTPDDLSDDHWTEYTVATDGEGGAIAVDTLRRLWLGNSKGLYRYADAQWQQIISLREICDLVPANNGVLFVAYDYTNTGNCKQLSLDVGRIEADGSGSEAYISLVIEQNLSLVRSTAHRNRLWTIAPDGAVWYTQPYFRGKLAPLAELHRRDDSGEQVYLSPLNREDVHNLSVDAHNHVWIVGDEALWRMSPKPDFRLNSELWLLSLGQQQRRRLSVIDLGGYQDPITMTLTHLPSGITAILEPVTVQAGEQVTVTISVDPGTPLGNYAATLIGLSPSISHTVPLTLSVVQQVQEQYLPLVRH